MTNEIEEVFVFRERYRDKEEYIALVVCYNNGYRCVLEREATEREIEIFKRESNGGRSIIVSTDD